MTSGAGLRPARRWFFLRTERFLVEKLPQGGMKPARNASLHEILHPGAVAGLDEGTTLGIVEEIAGLYRPTAGHIFFQDHDIAGLGEQQQERGNRQLSQHVLVMYMGKAVEYAPADDLFDNPLHPYTQALLSAVPRVGHREEPIALRSGPPSLLNPPAGCSFHPRCHCKLGGVCEEEGAGAHRGASQASGCPVISTP